MRRFFSGKTQKENARYRKRPYNKGASPSDIFQRNPSNQTDVRTSTDLVSALSQFQQGGNKHEIKSDKDPLTAHNLDQLEYY